MIKLIVTKGTIASGKSTWAKNEVKKNPEKVARISRDDLRNMMNGYILTDSNEKLITKVRDAAIIAALKAGRDVIVDETGKSSRVFTDICKIVKNLNIDCIVMEKSFYVDLETALERNSKREGTARIPDNIVEKFWKEFGGTQHKFYHPKTETFYKNQNYQQDVLIQDENLPKSLICDLDGSYALIGDRSPYDASKCDLTDLPNEPVVETVKLFYQAGYKIIFCSGRMNSDREPTVRFIEKHSPGMEYELFMRKTGDTRSDDIIKKEIFENDIKPKYNVRLVIDDRLSVCRLWNSLGLNLFRVGDPDANF